MLTQHARLPPKPNANKRGSLVTRPVRNKPPCLASNKIHRHNYNNVYVQLLWKVYLSSNALLAIHLYHTCSTYIESTELYTLH